MRKKLILGILSMVILLPRIHAERDPIFSEGAGLPSQISEFYDSYNFVSSFSTGAEREMLIVKYGKNGIPEDMETGRLGRVFNRMKRLKDQFVDMDSDMVLWVGPSPKFWKSHFRPVLFDVLGVHVSGNSAVVDVLAYEMAPETILRFISTYEQSDGDAQKIPSPKERILEAKCKTPEKALHRWILQNGQWKKRVADLYPLKEKKE